MLGTLCLCSIRWSPSGFFPGHAEQVLSVERSSFLAIQARIQFSYKKTTLLTKAVRSRTSCCPFGQRQGQAGGVITGTKRELPAGSCCSELAELSCGQARDKLCGWWICAAQHRLTVRWVSDSSMYSGLLHRIATFHPLIHIVYLSQKYYKLQVILIIYKLLKP